MAKKYRYGMAYRGFSIGCQPTIGLHHAEPDMTGKYYDILYYDRELTSKEIESYELVALGEVDVESRRGE